MREELYIIDGYKRAKLDLNSPSGITLSFQSNLFGDVSKITSSYSYTFKLPMTANNRRILDMAEDIRHYSSVARRKLKAEFYQDGALLFGDGYLYVDTVQENYECVMTWDVIKGFAELKENDKSLFELTDNGATAHYGYVVQSGVIGQKLIGEFDNSKNSLNPTYACGMMNYDILSNKALSISHPPIPVVPVYRLIQMINAEYGTQFNLGSVYDYTKFNSSTGEFLIQKNDIINRGVIPLASVARDEDEVAAEISTIGDLTFNANGADVGGEYFAYDYMNVLASDTPIYDIVYFRLTQGNPPQIKANNLYTLSSYFYNQWVESGVIKGGMQFELDGMIRAQFRNVKDTDHPEYALYEQPVMTIYQRVFQRDNDNPSTGKFNWDSVATVTGQVYSGGGATDYQFDFREAEGCKRLTVEKIGSDSYPFIIAFNLKLVSISGSMRAIPIYNENSYGNSGFDVKIVKNLPDISCMNFMKALFFMMGAFPVVNTAGEIVPAYFSDLDEAIDNGDVVDWSDKVIGDYASRPKKTEFDINGFGRNNYYMMKSDSAETAKKKNEDEIEVYADGKGVITVFSDVVEKSKTIIQTPFNAPFIQNKKYPSMKTGDTFNCWCAEHDDKEGMKIKFKEPKPCYGMIIGKPEKSYNGTGDLNNESNYTATGRWFEFMEAWNGFTDMEHNESYSYLQRILAQPIVITERMRLDNMDLMNLDYLKPVYLDKYNSFFAIITVKRGSDGSCEVEFIKLP